MLVNCVARNTLGRSPAGSCLFSPFRIYTKHLTKIVKIFQDDLFSLCERNFTFFVEAAGLFLPGCLENYPRATRDVFPFPRTRYDPWDRSALPPPGCNTSGGFCLGPPMWESDALTWVLTALSSDEFTWGKLRSWQARINLPRDELAVCGCPPFLCNFISGVATVLCSRGFVS